MYFTSNKINTLFYRNPVAQSTDACRGKIGFSRGRHAWEVIWEGPLGTVAMIGVTTKQAPLQCQGYVGLLGSDEYSWGWNLVDNILLHNGENQGEYPLLNNSPKYQVRFFLIIFTLYRISKINLLMIKILNLFKAAKSVFFYIYEDV